MASFTSTASDPDLPSNTLQFSLGAGAPPGASINAITGAFSWSIPVSQAPGTYPITVRVTDSGTPGLIDSETISITVNAVSLGGISGVKFEDRNHNRVQDADEPGLAGWTVFLDSDADGALDPGEPATVTNSTGRYAFNGLFPGNYTVAELPQAGWSQSYPGVTDSRLLGSTGFTGINP
jgi:hypothetical protein